jgi:hypothetical protein
MRLVNPTGVVAANSLASVLTVPSKAGYLDDLPLVGFYGYIDPSGGVDPSTLLLPFCLDDTVFHVGAVKLRCNHV